MQFREYTDGVRVVEKGFEVTGVKEANKCKIVIIMIITHDALIEAMLKSKTKIHFIKEIRSMFILLEFISFEDHSSMVIGLKDAKEMADMTIAKYEGITGQPVWTTEPDSMP